MFDAKQLTPEIPMPERSVQVALKNIIQAIHEALEENSAILSADWGEAANLPIDNIFMQDAAKNVLAAGLAGFIDKAQPRAHQFTIEHVEAFMEPLAPPPNTPDPVEKE